MLLSRSAGLRKWVKHDGRQMSALPPLTSSSGKQPRAAHAVDMRQEQPFTTSAEHGSFRPDADIVVAKRIGAKVGLKTFRFAQCALVQSRCTIFSTIILLSHRLSNAPAALSSATKSPD
jgi:hypothetical protein